MEPKPPNTPPPPIYNAYNTYGHYTTPYNQMDLGYFHHSSYSPQVSTQNHSSHYGMGTNSFFEATDNLTNGKGVKFKELKGEDGE